MHLLVTTNQIRNLKKKGFQMHKIMKQKDSYKHSCYLCKHLKRMNNKQEKDCKKNSISASISRIF